MEYSIIVVLSDDATPDDVAAALLRAGTEATAWIRCMGLLALDCSIPLDSVRIMHSLVQSAGLHRTE